jgi:hypothetical protein
MASLLIRFRPPPTLTEAEKRAWIARRARAGTAALTWAGSQRDAPLLRLDVPAPAEHATEERLADYLRAASAALPGAPGGMTPATG